MLVKHTEAAMTTVRRQWGRIATVMLLAGASIVPGAAVRASGSAGQVIVPADGRWVDTGIDVVTGGSLRISAWGTWTDGNATSGPDGSPKHWPDNFLNLEDIGVCAVCATTMTSGWGALDGYIGNAPPAPGSYTSHAVLPEAWKVFFVGSNFATTVQNSGRLWLNKNADAYSGHIVDNSGSIAAVIDTSALTPPAAGVPSIPDFVCLGGIGDCDGTRAPNDHPPG
ncbi:hypothetical protein Ait01nite_023320 [Actinoplanes italicus]|nr:hypothetical protein Ait01nite_023320 [Actinoplanes italicus]